MKKIFIFLMCLSLTSCATVSANKNSRLAEQGDARAQFGLATMYENGHGVKRDIGKALEWYRNAARNGHAGAQVNLGWFYQKGQYVEKDIKQAIDFYTKAANQGNSQAQLNLAVLYDEGVEVPEDDELAVKWYQMAAEQGNNVAQLNLGINYWKGKGVAQNYEKAWNLLNHVRMTSSSRELKWRARSILDRIKSELGVGSRLGEFSYPSWDKMFNFSGNSPAVKPGMRANS